MPEARNHLVEVPSAELQVRALAKLPSEEPAVPGACSVNGIPREYSQ